MAGKSRTDRIIKQFSSKPEQRTPFLASGGNEEMFIPNHSGVNKFLQNSKVDVSTETNLAVTSPITLTNDTIGIDQTAINHSHANHSLLTADDHTQYFLLNARSGGQTAIGGTGTTEKLIFRATSGIGATGADIIFQVGNNGSLEGLRVSGVTAVGNATGGTITTDGSYTVHTFTSSGTFTPDSSFDVDYLVVGGGGGGGGKDFAGNAVPGGGGGAGGFRTATGFAVTAQAYTITVGAGGAGGATNASGADGGNSVFSTITSAGGGGGGEYTNDPNGRAGGSGGGRVSNTGAGSGGAGNTPNTTPSQGNNGGGGSTGANWGCGGGGGASAVGADGTSTVGGNGGAGTSNSYSGAAVTYAGGGGGGMYNASGALGGSGGAGGGGAGGNGTPTNGTAGTANTGGGGGGAGGSNSSDAPSGGNGGSGIVIIRYLTQSSNYIAAAVGIGVTTPTAALHLKAGTTTVAPLKMNSGTLLTTAAAGAIEFLTDGFYGTITTGAARQRFTFREDNLSVFAATTSAQLAGVISDETGTGVLVFGTSPTFTTQITTPSIITASGALGITPAAGSNLNVTLSTTGDLAVNTNQLYVDTSLARVGINTSVPNAPLTIGALPNNYNAPSRLALYDTADSAIVMSISRSATSNPYQMAFGINHAGGYGEIQTLRDGVAYTGGIVMQRQGGTVSIGHITGAALLHLAAGTATRAPLKINAGTNLTTPEAGAIEFDGTNLYITQSGGTRKTIAYV